MSAFRCWLPLNRPSSRLPTQERSRTSQPLSNMLIDLPGRYESRKRAMAWLAAERIPHRLLFQQVRIIDDRDGERFKAWLKDGAGGPHGAAFR